MRYESKFILSTDAYQNIYNRILTSKYIFSEIYWERKINNIYLDTMEFKYLYDNINGVQNRIKHRIRWYGEKNKIKKPVLEYKIKHGELGEKEFFWLPGFSFGEGFDYNAYLEQIRAELDLTTPENIHMFANISTEIPTLYSSYWRRYFLSGDKKFRLTIDRDLNYTLIGRWFNNHATFREDKIVIDLKYSNPDIEGAGRIIQDLGLRATRNSKYVIGMRALYFNEVGQQF